MDSPRLSGTHTTQLCLSGAQYADSGSYTLATTGPYGSTTGPVTQVSLSLILDWGDNSGNQLNVPPGTRDVIALAAGAAHVLALHRDGTVTAWGTNDSGPASVPASATNVVSIAAGGNSSFALVSETPTPGPLQFEPVKEAAAAGYGTFHLRLTGLTGQGPVTIYASPDLVNWQPVHTNPPALGTLDYLDTPGGLQTSRYYRAAETQ